MKKIILLVFALILSLVLWKSLQRPSSLTPASPLSSLSPERTKSKASNLTSSSSKSSKESSGENLLNEVAGEFIRPKLDDKSIASYLLDQNRSIESLLAASITSYDIKYLLEALDREPKNPLLLYHALMFNDRSSDERLRWSETLLEQQPTNALAAAIHTANLFEDGNQKEALALLLETSNLTSWDDFAGPTVSATRGLHEHAGRSPVLAKFISAYELPMENQGQLLGFLEEMKPYVQANSPADSEAFRNSTTQLGQRMIARGQTGPSINTLLGLAIQQDALEGLPDDAASPFENLTVAEAKAHLEQQQESFRELLNEDNPIQTLLDSALSGQTLTEFPPGLTPDLLEGYIDRTTLAGEVNATQWLKRQLALKEDS